MTSTFHGIETSKRSLFTQMAAMNTTGHNIANASTVGYSRQTVGMAAAKPLEAPGLLNSTVPGQLGTGVEVTYIKRIRDGFLDDQYWDVNRSLGEWETQANTLSKLEKVFNEPSESGLTTVVDNFWKSWSEMSKDPENVTSRKIVKENALALVDAFNETDKKLSDMKTDLTQSLSVNAANINSLAEQVASLNREIYRIEGFRENANDLRDQRDLIIDQLSKMGNTTVVEEEDGYRVTIGGMELVNGQTPNQTTAANWESAYASKALTSGEMFGTIKSRDVIVNDYMDQLNQLASTLANGEVKITIPAGSVLPEGTVLDGITYSGATRTLTTDLQATVKGINGLHKLGYIFSTPVTSGVDIFTSNGGGPITAGSFQLNKIIEDDPNQIASSLRVITNPTGEEAVKGNNTIALLMSQLKDGSFKFSPIASNNGITSGTIDDYYRSTMGQLGVESREALRQQGNNQLLVDSVESRRQSVSGVSLDEEMANLIKFQHAYSAASRVMTTMDQNLDKIINSMGIVGR